MMLRPTSRAWLAAAVVTIAVVAGVILWWAASGNGSPRTDRTWLIRPSGATSPAVEQTEQALEVFRLRIRALGIGTFSSIAADDITFELPEDADESAIRAILSANGVLSFVPLPPELRAARWSDVLGEATVEVGAVCLHLPTLLGRLPVAMVASG